MSTPSAPMRVLQVISSSGYFGAENMIISLMKGLAAQDCQVALASLLTPAGGSADLARHARGLGFESHEIDCSGRLDRASAAALRHLASSGNFDVVHSHGYKADLYVRLAIDARRQARVATVHNWPVKTLKMRAYAALDKVALRGFDRVAAVSDAVLRELGRHGVPAGKLSFIENGVDPATFASGNGHLRRELGLAHAPVLGYVGRLAAEKGLEDLLSALPGVIARAPATRLLLIGDGPHRPRLEALAGTLGISQQVTFLGVRRDMADVYAAIDVLVLPSHDEGFPMTILEAMAAGRPVVATAVGQIPRMVVDHGTGRLVAPCAPEALAEALAALLEDPALAVQLGRQGQARVTLEFTAAIMAGKYLELYRQARSRVAPRPVAAVAQAGLPSVVGKR